MLRNTKDKKQELDNQNLLLGHEPRRHKIGRELKKRETRIGRTQHKEPYATHGVGLNCWGKIVVKMKCLGGLKA